MLGGKRFYPAHAATKSPNAVRLGIGYCASDCRIGRFRLDAYIPQMSPTFRIVCGILIFVALAMQYIPTPTLIFVALAIALQYIPTPTEDKK
jgi:hypothetical protein